MNNGTIRKPRSRKRAVSQVSTQKANYAESHRDAVVGIMLDDLLSQSTAELAKTAEKLGIAETENLSRDQLILAVAQAIDNQEGQYVIGEGTLQVLPDGYGFLRRSQENYLNTPQDIYVSPAQIRRFGLRTGMTIRGRIRPPVGKEQAFALMQVDSINGLPPAEARSLIRFEDLTPLHPDQRFILEDRADNLNMRVIDLLTPIGKGQRGLIVAPPRTGKTVLLQHIARSLLRNHPECYLFVLLIDERPEEVTEMRRAVAGPTSEVIASTFDAPTQQHIQVAEIVLEKAKRLVETGRDVVILLDSITRLARAYNAAMLDNGKTLTGGLAVSALDQPKRFFGAARNVDGGGSLTILATALIDTGSKMDQVIFEEFKGTGNMELHLDRRLVDKRVWPAININASGTRREELLLTSEELQRIWLLRKVLSDMHPVEAMERLIGQLAKTKSNAEFLQGLGLGR